MLPSPAIAFREFDAVIPISVLVAVVERGALNDHIPDDVASVVVQLLLLVRRVEGVR